MKTRFTRRRRRFCAVRLRRAPAHGRSSPAPNASGVSIGHVHINARRCGTRRFRFWTGGSVDRYPARRSSTMAQFPGYLCLLRKAGTISAVRSDRPSTHFGFYVRDFDADGRQVGRRRV